jgi:Fe-S-cluster containining protein
MNKESSNRRTSCIRCGECCLKASPTLHLEDIPLVRNGHIDKSNLYTIRVGELVLDNINDTLMETPHEMIKLRARKEGRGCSYYDEVTKLCSNHAYRPIQCKALACWDVSKFLQVHRRPKAVRKDIITDTVLRGLIDRHEEKCSYKAVKQWVKRIESEGDSAIYKFMDLLKFDCSLRPFVSEKLGVESYQMDFVFGRPLTETIIMFGLKVVRESDGCFFLTTLGDAHP